MAGIEDADTLAQLPAGTSESGQALALGLSDNNHSGSSSSSSRRRRRSSSSSSSSISSH